MTGPTPRDKTASFAVVVPTVGRESLQRLISALVVDDAPQPDAVIVVDDRADPTPPLQLPAGVTVLHSGGRGPAAARNLGWRSVAARWVCFVDDDVEPQPGWLSSLAADLRGADAARAAGSQAVIEVPAASGRAATDDEQRTLRLAGAKWITADMAYRRDVLVDVGGFDERFRRAYREDSDLALRITAAGHSIVRGARRSTHPVAAPTLWASVRAQIGNRDNALLRRKHGRRWRTAIGEGPGRMPAHLATVTAGLSAALAAVTGHRRAAGVALAAWAALTGEFAVRRFWAGPHTAEQAGRMLITSVLIPPAAVWHRLCGEWTFRNARRDPPLAVLFDRDDTIIEDGPYLNDPNGVRPLPGARDALHRLRERGLLIGVVTNQSGVAKGLISREQLDAVNARVDEMLGPFDTWQICVHDSGDGCGRRKPAPGMVQAAATALGVDASRCVLIGDTGGDVDAALSARADAVLVPTERTLPGEVERARIRARVATSIEAAVALVLQECR